MLGGTQLKYYLVSIALIIYYCLLFIIAYYIFYSNNKQINEQTNKW
jgi:hypothetical protein